MSTEIVGVYIDAAGNQVTVEPSKAATSEVEVETSSETSAVEEQGEKVIAEAEKVEADADSTSDEEVADDSEEAEKAPKRKSGFEKRIEKLNKKAAAAEMRAAELEARLAALEKPTATQSDTDFGLVKPKAEDFDTHADYVEALFEFAAKKRDAQAQADRQAAEQTAAAEKVKARFDEARKLGATKFDDFEDVTDLSDFDMKPTPVFSAFMQEIEDPSVTAALMYHLGSNRDEFKAILKLGEVAALKRLTKLELQLTAESTTAQKAEPEVKATKAPEPIRPVSGAKSTPVARITDDMSADEYRRIRREQLRAKK